MKINRIQEIAFDTDETIVTATSSAEDEIVMLMSSGRVTRYKIGSASGELLFSVKSDFTYEDDGFDLNAASSIYTLNSIVVVVNDYKRHGFIHYPGKYKSLHLWRKDYHADISSYPICLFKDSTDTPHLIYGVAWNHLQIMNLETRQILTASKSLIKEFAEESHIEFYKNYSEDSKLAWPSEYDYFYGNLEMSPDNKHFLSAGWSWGSFDSYQAYNVEHFITENRIAQIHIGGWEHDNRPICWVDNTTVAVGCNPYAEEEEDSTKDSPNEIHFYRINDNEFELLRKIEIPTIEISKAKFQFVKQLNSLIIFSDDHGLTALSLNGEILFQDPEIRLDNYNPKTDFFVKVKNKTVSIYQLAID